MSRDDHSADGPTAEEVLEAKAEEAARPRTSDGTELTGIVAWCARNSVFANLLMMVLLIGGLLFFSSIKKEVFPEIELDMVTVSVAYPGASPEEIEEGVVLAVEEEVRGVDGVEKIRSVSQEGVGVVVAELLTGADNDRALSDIKSAVDRITSFPLDAERPVISLATNRNQVLYAVVYGDTDRRTLDHLAEDLRAQLLQDERITLVEVDGLPPPEISVEVPQETLRRYGLTLDQIAAAISAASIDLPGGAVKTEGGEVLVRTTERRDFREEFEQIAVLSGADGTRVTLGDLATVRDTYRETDEEAFYDGKPAVRLRVFRIGDQTPTEVAAATREVLERRAAELPASVGVEILNDQSEIYDDRIGLLVRNGRLGALLVVLVLGLFLQPRLAFWVALGLPISFLGACLLMPPLGVSINMISLFAFILVLGIVVDDAVVVGEAVFHHRNLGKTPLRAAIEGTREVLAPVTFAVMTTIFAFAPLLFVPGISGKFFRNIPLIVIPILIMSLVESLFILPAHLAHVKRQREVDSWRWLQWIYDRQRSFSDWIERTIEHRFVPFERRLLRVRYLALAGAVGLLIVTVGVVAGNHLKFFYFPRIEGDQVSASVELPFGAPVAETSVALDRVVEALYEITGQLEAERGDEGQSPLVEGVYSQIGTSTPPEDSGINLGAGGSGGHLALAQVTLSPSDERSIGAVEITRRWRQAVGEIPGVERLAFNFNSGPSAGAPISIELSHRNLDTLERAASRLAETLAGYSGVFDIDDGFQVGKPQLDLELRPSARSLGITEADLAQQIRSAFFGAEARRQQRGRDELRVYVRRPREERESLYHVEKLLIRTPGGGEIPLGQAAYVDLGRSYTAINRVEGRRTVTVTADVNDDVTTPNRVISDVRETALAQLLSDYPGLGFSLAGEQEEQARSVASLARGMMLALFAMYALMAIAFRSYLQPIVVLAAIPFGIIGAFLGHLLLGYDLSFISIFGIVALSGVVVNDSLVLISAINDNRREGMRAREAVILGAARRVRPVLLTSLTTFFGLAPIMLERSLQARFLIPMAISLAFGVLFVTVIALILVPCGYMALEDLKRFARSIAAGVRGEDSEPEPQSQTA